MQGELKVTIFVAISAQVTSVADLSSTSCRSSCVISACNKSLQDVNRLVET